MSWILFVLGKMTFFLISLMFFFFSLQNMTVCFLSTIRRTQNSFIQTGHTVNLKTRETLLFGVLIEGCSFLLHQDTRDAHRSFQISAVNPNPAQNERGRALKTTATSRKNVGEDSYWEKPFQSQYQPRTSISSVNDLLKIQNLLVSLEANLCMPPSMIPGIRFH